MCTYEYDNLIEHLILKENMKKIEIQNILSTDGYDEKPVIYGWLLKNINEKIKL